VILGFQGKATKKWWLSNTDRKKTLSLFSPRVVSRKLDRKKACKKRGGGIENTKEKREIETAGETQKECYES